MIYILCSLISAAGAFFMVRAGSRLGFVDKVSDRSSHTGIVPKAGGVGILIAFVVAALTSSASIYLFYPTVLASLVGLFSDRFDIGPLLRLALYFAVTLIFAASVFGFYGNDMGSMVLLLCSVVFIVGTANIFNFMDGINGIAGITGAVAFAFLSYVSFRVHANIPIAKLSACVSVACLGFLPFNFPRAKVFMGDVGSILLGFLFGGIVVSLSKSIADFLFLSSFLFLFYADELTTMIFRVKRKENLMQPHRLHLYQLLVNEMGLPHWLVSIAYGVSQLAIGASVLLLRAQALLLFLLLTTYFLIFYFVSHKVRARAVLQEV